MENLTLAPKDASQNESNDSVENAEKNLDQNSNFSEENTLDNCEYDTWSPD